MKKLLPVAFLVALAVVMLAAALPALGTTSGNSLATRVARLEAKTTAMQKQTAAMQKQTAAMQNQVTALQAKNKALQATVTTVTKASAALVTVVAAHEKALGCMKKAAPIGQYGSTAGPGYAWAANGSMYYTTALDLVPTGQTPMFYGVTVDASCVSTGSQFQAFHPQTPFGTGLTPALLAPIH